ncbi:MAG: AtpZ/AtpI family protein [bacterium]|nr:AtpZ/AtpI family protein [bacterium]
MDRPTSKTLITVGVALQLGFSIAMPLVLFIGVGIWIDKKFDVLPLFTIIGVLLSTATTVLEIMQVIKSVQRK